MKKHQCSTCKYYTWLSNYKGSCHNATVKKELPYQYNDRYYNDGCRHWDWEKNN